MIHTLRSLTQLVALPLCFAYLLLGCASPGPEFTAWYKEHASTTEMCIRDSPEAELSALSDEVFGHEQPSELLADVVAAEAAARPAQTDEKPPGAFGLAALRLSLIHI